MTEAAAAVQAVVTRVVEALGFPGPVEVVETEDQIVATVHGDDLGLFIGRHGVTIDAIQHLAQRVAQRVDRETPRIVVDAEQYRERRRLALEGQADRACNDAIEGGRAVALDAMTSSERRLIHEYLRDRDDIETHSEGEEPNRHLVISPATAA